MEHSQYCNTHMKSTCGGIHENGEMCTHTHKHRNTCAQMKTQTVSSTHAKRGPKKFWKIEGARNWKDSGPEGLSYRQLVSNHHKVLPALTTLYNVHQYILHYIK